VRFLVSICMVFLVSSVTTPDISASAKHNCAFSKSPAVAGPLIQPAALHGQLFINEVLLYPISRWNCAETATYSTTMDMWVEIYNSQNVPFDLYAVHSRLDSGPSTNPFFLPLGTAIAPHNFLVVFLHMLPQHMLSKMTELRLLIDGIVIDKVTVPPLSGDEAYARVPDGSPNWQITNSPTIDASNNNAQSSVQTTSTPGIRQGSGNNSNSNGGIDNTSHTQEVDGVQPAWNTLQSPSTPSPAANITQHKQTSGVSAQTDNNTGLLQKALFTALAIALALTLLAILRRAW